MDINKIKSLLEKYENGETDIAEESSLESFFTQSEESIPEEWKPYAELFKWRQSFRQNVLHDSFEDKLRSKLVSHDGKPSHKNPTKTVFKLDRRRILQIAASVAILLVSTWVYKSSWLLKPTDASLQLANKETFDDPELAYQQTVEALAYLSSKLNKGQRKAAGSISKLKALDQAIPN